MASSITKTETQLNGVRTATAPNVFSVFVTVENFQPKLQKAELDDYEPNSALHDGGLDDSLSGSNNLQNA